jgi:hypothetical protein
MNRPVESKWRNQSADRFKLGTHGIIERDAVRVGPKFKTKMQTSPNSGERISQTDAQRQLGKFVLRLYVFCLSESES